MKRRDLLLGSVGLLVPTFARADAPCPLPQTGIATSESIPFTCLPSDRTYTTNFPLTENPISDGGRWTSGGVFGKTDVQTAAGRAFGTMVSFNGSQYIDSCACLRGFGADHEVFCTISNNDAANGLEVEILLRADLTPEHAFLYELDCVYSDRAIHLARWDMTKENPNSFAELGKFMGGHVPLSNGDQVHAKIVGTVITCQYKRADRAAFSRLFTYDTARDAVRHTSGNPGIGFWNETGSASNQSKLAWSNFTANTL